MNWPWKKKKLSFAETAKFNWEADTNEELRQKLNELAKQYPTLREGEYREKLLDAVSMFDDEIMEMYLEGQEIPTDKIRKAIRQTSAGAFLALDPDTSRRFIAAVGAAAGDYRKHVQMPVLLASMDIRRYVRRLIEGEHYRLPVVSYQELTPEISVQPMNRIRL